MKEKRGWRVMDDKGNYYSKHPLTKKRATAQLRALYASYSRGYSLRGKGFATYVDEDDNHHIVLQGSGWFSDIFTKIKSFSGKVATTLGKVGSVLTPQNIRTASDILATGIRSDYPPDVRNVLAQYGNGQVYSLAIYREPIKEYIDNFLNIISVGQWNQAKQKANYDRMFHLSMVASLAMPDGNRGQVMIEKNEVINITPHFTISPDAESIQVPVPCCFTLMDMLNKAQQQQGEAFFKYNAFTNNCQIFIMTILLANNLSNPTIQQFVSQNAEQLVAQLPEHIPAVASFTTNLAGFWNRISKGKGMVGGGNEGLDMSALRQRYDAMKILNNQQLLDEAKKININARDSLGRDNLLYIACGSPNDPDCGPGGYLKDSQGACVYWTQAVEEFEENEHYQGVAGVGTSADVNEDPSKFYFSKQVRKDQEAEAQQLAQEHDENGIPPVPQWEDIPYMKDVDWNTYTGFVKTGHYCPDGCDYDPWEGKRGDDNNFEWQFTLQEIQQYAGGIDGVRQGAEAGNKYYQDLIKRYDSWYDPSIKITIPPETQEDQGLFGFIKNYDIMYLVNGIVKRSGLKPGTIGVSTGLLRRVADRFIENKGFFNSETAGKKGWVLQVEGTKGATGNTLMNMRKDLQDENIAFNDVIEYDKNGAEKFDSKKHLTVEWLNSVEGRHRREQDPYFEEMYKQILANENSKKKRTPDQIAKRNAELQARYERELVKRYGDNKDIVKPGTIITDKHGNKRELYKVRLRVDGGWDIQWRDGTWEYTPGESEWECNKFDGERDRAEDWGVCGTEARKKASKRVNDNMNKEIDGIVKARDKQWDNLSGWDKFVNGLSVAGAFTQDYILPVVSFIPGAGVLGTIADATSAITDAINGDSCRHFNECTDRMVEAKQQEKQARVGNSLYHETVGDNIANKYMTDDGWTSLLEGNDKAIGLVRDTINYGSRAGKFDATGKGKPTTHEMKQALRLNAIPRMTIEDIESRGIEEPETVPEIYKQPIIPKPLMNGAGATHISRRFAKDLRDAGFTPTEYLNKVRDVAEKHGYSGDDLMFSDNDEHKLMIATPDDKIVRFGRVGYGDYIIWSKLESDGEVRNGYASMKRRVFNKSHSAIKGDWKSDKYSPNMLALKILW